MTQDKTERFLRLLAMSEDDIYRYIVAMVLDFDTARDVLQETLIDLWKKFDEYDPARPFAPWACRFAFMRVLNLRKKQRSFGILLTERALENISEQYTASRDELDDRKRALVDCMGKLPRNAQLLIHQRYSEGRSIQEIAGRSQRSVHTLYKKVSQIREWLMNCTQGQLEKGGAQ